MIFVQEILDGIDNLRNLCIDSETEICPELCPNDKCAIQILYNKLIKHGRWIQCADVYSDGDYECSECHKREWSDTDYCPNCGAKMEGEKNV